MNLYKETQDILVWREGLTKQQASDAMEKIGNDELGEHFSAGCYDIKDFAVSIASRYKELYLTQK